jgi:hypothetical protein
MSGRKGFTAEMIERNLTANATLLDRREAGYTTVGLFEGHRRGGHLACRSTWETDGEPHAGVHNEWFDGDLVASSFEHPENPQARIEVHRMDPDRGRSGKHGPITVTPQGAFLSPLFWASPLQLPEVADLHEGETTLIVEMRAKEMARTCGDRSVGVDGRYRIELDPAGLQIRRISRYLGTNENAAEVDEVEYENGFPSRVVRRIGKQETIYERVSFGLDPEARLPMPVGVQVADWRFGPKSGVFYDSRPDFLTDQEVLNTMPPIARTAFKIFQR